MTHTLVASVAIPAPTDGIIKVTWSLEGVFLQESSIGFEDLPNGSLQTYLVQFATTHLMHNRACHGTAIKYDSTLDKGLRTGGIMVWELDFDSYTPTGTIFDEIIEHFSSAEYLKRVELASETAISIITSAGYAQPESPDDLGEDIQNSVQTYLMAAMMRSDQISRTLFAAINDHIRLINLGPNALPTGDELDPILVCICGEVFDTLGAAAAHTHSEDDTPDPSAEFEFRISTRSEAM